MVFMVLFMGIFPEFYSVFIFVCPHTLIEWHSGVSDEGKDPLNLLDEKDGMSLENEAIGTVITDEFRLQES